MTEATSLPRVSRFRISPTNPNAIESNDGVTVEILGRTGIRYTEGERAYFVDSDVLATPAIAVSATRIRAWDDSHEVATLTDADRQRIFENIAEAFASQDWQLEGGRQQRAGRVAETRPRTAELVSA
jgi:Immunity protein 74